MEGLADISSLSNLLTESKKAIEAKESHIQQKPGAASTTVVKRGTDSKLESSNKPQVTEKKVSAKDIWNVEEIPTEESLAALSDGRPAPKYEFSYKQLIGTEDAYLGMGDKTPLTSDCTHLVVKIHFPGATKKDLDLEVKKNRIKATSKSHRLFTYLPVDVNETNGKAEFDTSREVLTVTLPIIHEF
jgi:hypothetical protein